MTIFAFLPGLSNGKKTGKTILFINLFQSAKTVGENLRNILPFLSDRANFIS